MKKRILFIIISSLAMGLYAQEEAAGNEDPANFVQEEVQPDSVVEELEAIAAESAETAQEQAYQEETYQEPEVKKRPSLIGRIGTGVLDYFTQPATTRHNEAIRYFELGFDGGGGFGNSLLGVKDILKKDIVIDLDTWGDKISGKGVDFGFDVSAHQFINFNAKKKGWGVGEFVNVDGRVDTNLPKSLFDLIAEGNSINHDQNGEFSVSGAVFAEAGVKWYGTFLNKKLRIGVAPAYYLPVLYIPKSESTIKYELETEDRLYVKLDGAITVYTPFSYDDFDGLSGKGGIDLSLSGEYALFPILDVGATISHIPFYFATLSEGTRIDLSKEIINVGTDKIFDGLDDIGSIDSEQESFDGASLRVKRPMRFDFYVLYRPFRRDILTIKPNVGFTVFNPSEKTYFNGALEAQLNVGRILFLSLGTGREEGYWRHRLGFALNMRILELDITGSLKSQDYKKSYQLSGLDVTVGLKLGF